MIRIYHPADHSGLIDLFARAGADSPPGVLWRHLPSERMVYLDPYVEHCPETLFLAEVDGGSVVDPRWPAHLHINVVPEARGTGVAHELMTAWQDWLTRPGCPGCFLQTLVENTRAARFFEKCGFVAQGPTPLVPGARHQGRPTHQLTMVWPPPR